jgi:hypothetical protein
MIGDIAVPSGNFFRDLLCERRHLKGYLIGLQLFVRKCCEVGRRLSLVRVRVRVRVRVDVGRGAWVVGVNVGGGAWIVGVGCDLFAQWPF